MHHYGIGGKCYPSTGTFRGLGQAYLQIQAPKSRYEKINETIASEVAKQYHGIFLTIIDSNTNFYALNYEDLTELNYGKYITLLIDKFSIDRISKTNYQIYIHFFSNLIILNF